MGYSQEHVAATRRRILQSAGRLFRRHGFNGVGIEEIMAGADLTRGSFYSHFDSKDDLFRAVLEEEDLEFVSRLRALGEDAIDYYLDPRQRNRIGRGCTMVSNAADVARASTPARSAFTASFEALVAEFAELADREDEARSRALSAVATCVGGVTLARAIGNEKLAGELLAACQAAVGERLGSARTTRQ